MISKLGPKWVVLVYGAVMSVMIFLEGHSCIALAIFSLFVIVKIIMDIIDVIGIRINEILELIHKD